MADHTAQEDAAPAKRQGTAAEKAARLGFFARIAQFVRQVIAELKKAVTPTRSELINYTVVVVVFVLVVMAFVLAVDFLFGKLMFWMFG